METNVNYTIVGAFVISILSILIFSVIWLSSGLKLTGYQMYKVYMSESVSGLHPDASVEYNGVDVGTVKSIDIDPKNPHQIILLLNIKSTTPITVATRAMLNVKALTGIATLTLRDDGANHTKLKAIPPEEYPVIQTAPSLFLRLDTALTKINESFSKISQSVEFLLNEKNQRAIEQILKNTEKASQELTPFLKSSEKTVESLQKNILPATQEMMTNMNELTEDLSVLSAEIKQNPSVLIRGKTTQPLGPGEK